MDEVTKEVESGNLDIGESSQEQIDEFLEDQPIEEEEVIKESDTKFVEEKALAEEPAKIEEEVVKEEKKKDEIVENKEDSSIAEIASLKAQIEAMQVLVDKLAVPTTKVEESAVPTKIKELAELLEEVDFDSVMESKENFSKFFLTAMQAVQEQTAQKILSSIPNIVGSHVQRQATLKDVATEFYNKYPELKRVKRYVGTVANEVYAANPDWNLGQIMEETARVTKETLNIRDSIETKEKKESAKPALPGSGGGVRGLNRPSSKLQSEIDELLID